MLDPSVSLSWESDWNPLTGHGLRTSEREHIGMFWQSLGLASDEKREAHMEGSLYSAQLSFPQCRDGLSKGNLSWTKPQGLRVVTQLCSHGETPDNCLRSSGFLVSRGSGWDRHRRYKQEPDLQENFTVGKMTNNDKKKRKWDCKKVILSEPEILKIVGDNEQYDRGAYGARPDMCKNMWKTFTGLTGHDLCFLGDSQGSQVTLSRPPMMNVQWKWGRQSVCVWV